MSDRERIWAVTSGAYSDYRVLAVFDSKDAANRAAGLSTGYESYSVESLLFCGEDDDPVEMLTTYDLSQEFRDDGTFDEPRVHARTEPWFDQLWEAGPRPRVRFVRAPIHNGKGGRLEVRGTDLQAVLKAATDRKAMLLAHCDQTGKVGTRDGR